MVLSMIFIYILYNLYIGRVSFGYGLADVLGAILFFVLFIFLVITYLIVVMKIEKDKLKFRILITFILAFTLILFLLSLTFFRGATYPWDGTFFLF